VGAAASFQDGRLSEMTWPEWVTAMHITFGESTASKWACRVQEQPQTTGPWDQHQISEFLDNARIPIRVSSMGSNGPIVQSLWFLFNGEAIWCATQASSVLAQRLGVDSRIGFEVAADQEPYRGVRGTGQATIHPDLAEGTLRRLIQKYQGDDETELSRWLLSRLDKEVAIRISPTRLATWDFSGRMGSGG